MEASSDAAPEPPPASRAGATTDRTLRPPRSAWWILATAFLVVAAMTGMAFAVDLDGWIKACFVAFSALLPAAFVELALTRLTLEDERLVSVDSFRRRVLARRDIESVTWAKGAGVSVRLRDGSWVRLAPVGRSPQGVTNTVRSWLAKSTTKDGGRTIEA